jgi:hypothetical protein
MIQTWVKLQNRSHDNFSGFLGQKGKEFNDSAPFAPLR